MEAGIQSHSLPLQGGLLLSDEQLDYYAELFIRLNEQYSLTTQYRFSFEDFLARPEEFECAIHRYFANKPLFENRPNGAVIKLRVLLDYPMILVAVIDSEQAQREQYAVQAEQLLPKQYAAIRKINLAEIAWFAELVALTFERHRHVLLRGGAFVEPNHHYNRRERKKAGGKR